MLVYLLQGIVLGFAAGISPGPMLGLVISQTLQLKEQRQDTHA